MKVGTKFGPGRWIKRVGVVEFGRKSEGSHQRERREGGREGRSKGGR